MCFLALALAIGLHQDFNSWPTDVALFFAASLLGLVMTFPSHFLTSSEDFVKSKRKNMYFLMAGKHPPVPIPLWHKLRFERNWRFLVCFVGLRLMGVAAIQFSGFGLCAAAFIYGLATNENGKCEAAGYYFCTVFRIALAFDLLLGYTPLFRGSWIDWVRLLQLAGVICIGLSMRPPKAHADHY